MTPAASGVTPDQDIIDELRGGDRTAAFRKLVERFDERIFRLCCSILRDHALAEDAAQESLMRIWRMIRHSGWRTNMTISKNGHNEMVAGEPWPASLEIALLRTLRPPRLSQGFRSRLLEVIDNDSAVDIQLRRSEIASEYRKQAAALEQGYVRLKWRTLGTLIGAAFTTGVAVALVLPWIRETWGSVGENVSWSVAAAAFVIATVAVTWLRIEPSR